MVFNSITFIVFFSIVVFLHNLPFSWRVKKFNLLVASYIFYAAWNPPFVLLLLASTLAGWLTALGINRTQSLGGKKLLLFLSLLVNLGLLAYFKYAQFFLDSFISLVKVFGVAYSPPRLSIILPLGISFFTFQTMSYTIDVYRGTVPKWHSFLDFALYVSFFPQLVAGPIVRSGHFLPQCEEPRRGSSDQLGWGLILLLIGLFQKIFLADGLMAQVADPIFVQWQQANMIQAWAATLAFSAQIFFDFSGYSTCAIGAALCLGFSLPDNFRFPYASLGFSDFWRRWHISLSTWLRDYLYIPLGGNRKGVGRTYINLMLTMLIGGLWHGAAFNFIIWGGLHGIFLAVERFIRERRKKTEVPRVSGPLAKISLICFTYFLVLIAWVFFRADNFGIALHFLKLMFGFTVSQDAVNIKNMYLLVAFLMNAILLTWHFLMRDTSLEKVAERLPWWIKGLAIAAMLLALVLAPGERRAFIYFQF